MSMSNELKSMCNLEFLRAALQRPDFSHVSYRTWCGHDLLCVYVVVAASPTNCTLLDGFSDTDETRAVLAECGKRAQAGGQR